MREARVLAATEENVASGNIPYSRATVSGVFCATVKLTIRFEAKMPRIKPTVYTIVA